MLPRLGPLELIIILVIVMMVFGVGKLPDVGRSMGKAIREFKSAQNDLEKPSADVKADSSAVDGAKPAVIKAEGTKTS